MLMVGQLLDGGRAAFRNRRGVDLVKHLFELLATVFTQMRRVEVAGVAVAVGMIALAGVLHLLALLWRLVAFNLAAAKRSVVIGWSVIAVGVPFAPFKDLGQLEEIGLHTLRNAADFTQNLKPGIIPV